MLGKYKYIFHIFLINDKLVFTIQCFSMYKWFCMHENTCKYLPLYSLKGSSYLQVLKGFKKVENPWTGAWPSHASAYGFTAKEAVNVDLKESDLALFTHRMKLRDLV